MLLKRENVQSHDKSNFRTPAPGGTALVFAALHIICCGVLLLLLSGVSLAFLVPLWPVAGAILAVVGVIGFAWYLKRGCATCPRNEGCSVRRETDSAMERSNDQGV